MTYLPDVNVWIALAADKHIHHSVARSWFTKVQDEKLAFCRITQLAFLRLLTNKHRNARRSRESVRSMASI